MTGSHQVDGEGGLAVLAEIQAHALLFVSHAQRDDPVGDLVE